MHTHAQLPTTPPSNFALRAVCMSLCFLFISLALIIVTPNDFPATASSPFYQLWAAVTEEREIHADLICLH